MSLVALLRKEFHWSKRNVLVVLFLVVLIPVFFAGTSLLFQDVLPRNVPVAVVAEDDSLTDEELETVAQTIDSFTNPRVAGSRQAAKRQLERESVYGIVTVPPDATTEGAEVQVTFTVDGSIVPFQSPSQVYQRLMEFYLDGLYDSDLTVEQRVDGERLDLNEYLFPTFLMAFAIFFAFTSVPYVFRREAAVMDRLRFETSLEAVVASKLVFLSALLAGPIIVFHVANVYYGYGIDSLDPAGLAVLVLTFLLLATFATTVMVLSRFGGVGTFVNLVVMLALLALSALAFPLGFFSTVRTTIAGVLPTHYAMIIVRSMMLKDASITTFLDWLAALVGLGLLSLLVLEGAIVRYRRSA